MEKITLQNRKGQNVVGLLKKPEGEIRGTCIVQHGWSGKKDQAHIVAIQNAFFENGFQTFNFDTTNSFNESDGEYSKSRLGLHYEDFEDVTKWAQKQGWFVGPLALTGHSMGGYAAARYAEDYPDEVALTAPIAPVVSGELRKAAYLKFDPEDLEEWEKQGVLIKESGTNPGLIKEAPYEAFVEMQNHNLLPAAKKLTMPVFLLTGSEDTSIPPEHVQKLFDVIPGNKKTFKIIQGAPHTYVTEAHLKELKDLMSDWISSVT
jgi:pimeloyl-ACP methyl ester carboxylesterase